MSPQKNGRGVSLTCLCIALVLPALADAQYEKYSFQSFPPADIMPLDSAYGHALEQYGAQKWKECVKYLELSLRLHRLLQDSESFCGTNCSAVSRDNDTLFADSGLRVMRHFVLRAACLKKCKANFPVFSLAYPQRDTLDAFEKRAPYRYIQYAYYQSNNLAKAVSAAHTFLQKNPEDPYLTKNMKYYKTLSDVDKHLIDHEERPFETVFLKAVKLYNSEDFSSSARDMEQAIAEYFKAYELCQAACEGSYEIVEVKDFYPTLADLYTEVLKCKVKCEENLTPNVGGFFVEKFVATMYHYLQFAYYKVNNVKKASPCAASYMLFDPSDEVMQQNVAYYRFHRKQWGLDEEHFLPQPEAQKYYNQTTKQKEMLQFALNYLQTDDEDVVSPEEAGPRGPQEPPDAEFDGVGDYEESFVAEWWQEPKTKWDTGKVVD
ncbi:hypothetical protein NHX12_032550 [Muraenolepis orangiensis]|uniref:Endoplasmic reticulum protein SC65 n=1 Tax=Muraenolepis orangiensis TaxID=630683 RepID=A0A9Q0E5V8_9TELE|nr:hypothetical protein NHX12_032550 [Muraenolepis orangiensis]